MCSASVQCLCGMQVNSGTMIQCETCSIWLHERCLGIDSRQLVRAKNNHEPCSQDTLWFHCRSQMGSGSACHASRKKWIHSLRLILVNLLSKRSKNRSFIGIALYRLKRLCLGPNYSDHNLNYHRVLTYLRSISAHKSRSDGIFGVCHVFADFDYAGRCLLLKMGEYQATEVVAMLLVIFQMQNGKMAIVGHSAIY